VPSGGTSEGPIQSIKEKKRKVTRHDSATRLTIWRLFTYTKFFENYTSSQGDQIGMIFAQRAFAYFGQLLENFTSIFCAAAVKFVHSFLRKLGWATFQSIFSQTYLVTLEAAQSMGCFFSVVKLKF
jgi:hypothetical protein